MKRPATAQDITGNSICWQLMRLVVLAIFVSMCIGIVFAWVFYFRSYDKEFRALEAEELHLAQEIYNEIAARTLADMALAQAEAVLNSTLLLDIATREAEQAFVNQSLINDTAARQSGDAALSAALAAEIAQRIANDTLLAYGIGNATATLEVVEAFDIYSSRQFMIIENNITVLLEEINAEIATRIAAQAALAAADAIIDADLVLLISEMNAEIAARIAQDNSINLQLHLITTSLLLTINGQSPINDNMVFESLSSNLLITNGSTSNEILVTQNALATLAGVGPDATGNLGITANSGLSITFPSPHTIAISYLGPVPPSPKNYARLVAVYPFPQSTQEVQGINGRNLKNGLDGPDCDAVHAPTQCATIYGSEWSCSTGNQFPTSLTMNRCVNTACTDETQCNDILGQPWHCRGGNCVEDFCAYHTECIDAFGMGWYCVNYGCTQGLQNSPYLPIYSGGPPYVSGIGYQSIGQPYPNQGSSPCANCIFPQPGAYNNNRITYPSTSAYPFVYGNRRPYDPASTYPGPEPLYSQQECIFAESWEGLNCGFIMPGAGTYIVQITVVIRAAINQPPACYGHMWFYMHIDRTGGSPPNWEEVDSDYMAINNICSGSCPILPVYITMSTTLILSSATPSSSGTEPITPGTLVYAGWSAYSDYEMDCANQYAAWYSITYDITQVA